MVNCISILGSTGSIGTQSLDVVRKLGLKVAALTANSNIELLEKQIREFTPRLAVVFDEEKARLLARKIKSTDTKVLSGMNGLLEAAAIDGAQLVVNALVGMVGLTPTLEAARAKKIIALANKETLVAGGRIVMNAVRQNNIALLPVDSEHSAIFQCLQGSPGKNAVKKLILTASGGPFFGKSAQELINASVKDALNHPNWSMGDKITVDSATMMNKGLEIIEASWLFDMPEDKIDVVVHRESVVHSMIEFNDNSVIAQLGLADMRIPIQYAVTYPERCESPVSELDLTKLCNLSFYKPDEDTFEAMSLCRRAIRMGGVKPAALNGANEAANLLFRQGKIKFFDIPRLVKGALEAAPTIPDYTLDDVLNADGAAREYVQNAINSEVS